MENLSFSYKNQKVFANLNDQIEGNQFIAIVGANGSGKSTLMKLIMGLLLPESGDIHVLGKKPGNFNLKNSLGSSLQDIDFPATEKVEELLQFVGQQYRQHQDLEDLIESFSLGEFRKKSCGQLSGGMRRRLSLACAFSGKPRLVLLDEPTTGLDHKSRSQLMVNLKKYQQANQALVLMISHYPGEVIDFVDQFFHVKDSMIKRLAPAEMEKFTHLKKVSFDSAYTFNESEVFRMHRSGDHYEMIVKDSDAFVKKMAQDTIPFSNLLVQNLEARELIEEIL